MNIALAPPQLKLQRTNGSGRLAWRLSGGATRVAQLFEEGAARIRFPRSDSDIAEAVLINTSGGLTGGDRLNWHLAAGAGTKTAATTQACEKIYRSPDGEPAIVDTTISVGSCARLDWLPQETILFNRSALRRSLTVDLAPEAVFLAVEAVIAGRQAMGETVDHAFFHERWRIRREGRLLFADALRFEGPLSALLDRPAIAGGGRAWAMIGFFALGAERRLEDLRAACPGLAASAFDGKLLARFIAGDAYRLRQMLVPALGVLCNEGGLPKVWAL